MLADPVTWSTYAEFRRLLDAVAAELGEEALPAIGLDSFADVSVPESTAMLQSLGSPSSLYADIGPAAAALTRVVGITSEELGPNQWMIEQRIQHGLEPFREYCLYSIGLLAVTPRLFGYQPAEVVEESCQCDGARGLPVPDHVAGDGRGHATGRAARRAGEAPPERAWRRCRSPSATSCPGEDLEDVLPRIISSAARAVRAPGFVLAIDQGVTTSQRIYSDGFEPEEAARIADELLQGDRPSDAHCLVVELASTRCTYGRLAALNPSGAFYPQELATLQAYGRLATAALDAAAAIEETRTQAMRAEALLALSSALAEIVSTEEMAQRIAEAVPSVVDCDRAVVVLVETETVARIAGVSGYPANTAAVLKGRRIAARAEVPVDVTVQVHGQYPDGERTGEQDFMDWTGTVAAATFPITSARPRARLHHRQRDRAPGAAHRLPRPRRAPARAGRPGLDRPQQRRRSSTRCDARRSTTG